MKTFKAWWTMQEWEYVAANYLGVEYEHLGILEESGHMLAGLMKDQMG
jgi:hypothetical protein